MANELNIKNGLKIEGLSASEFLKTDSNSFVVSVAGSTINLSEFNNDIGAGSGATLLDELNDVTTGIPGSPDNTYQGRQLYFDVASNEWLANQEYASIGTVTIWGKKGTAGTISKGLPVYITGFDNDIHDVELANAGSSSTMPVIGFTAEDFDDVTTSPIVTFGKITGLNTTSTVSTLNPNGETWAVNDALYMSSTTGGLTKTRPTGASTQIQRIAKVLKVDATGGQLFIFNTARTAGLPNLTSNYLWLGDGNNTPQEVLNTTVGLYAGSGTVPSSTVVTITDTLDFGASGLLSIDQAGQIVTVAGDLNVQGTTTTIDSTVTSYVDPIISLNTLTGGGDPISDNAKDIGINGKWFDSAAKDAFFGFDRSSQRFTFIPDATITSEIVSGTLGDVEFNKAYLSQIQISTSPSNGYFLKSDASGNGSWAQITTADVSGSIGGSGTNNYVAKWTPDGTTLGNSLIQDDGAAIELTGSYSNNYRGLFTLKNEVYNPVNNNFLIGLKLDNRYLGTPATNINITGLDIVTTNVLGGSSNIGIRNGVNGTLGIGGSHIIGILNLAGSSITNNEQIFGIYNQVGPPAGNTNTSQDAIGIFTNVMPNIGGGNAYLGQFKDGTEGVGKFLKSVTFDGKANWAQITKADITNGISGSGINNYLARWTPDGTTLSTSMIQDNGSTISIGTVPDSVVQFKLNTTLAFGSYFTNNYTGGAQAVSVVGYTGGANSATNYGAQFTGTNSSVSNIGIGAYATSSGTSTAIAGYFSAGGSTTGNKHALQLRDGTEGTGKFLKSIDGNGHANWAQITKADITNGIDGGGTNNYVSKWTPDGTTLGDSLIQDDGTSIGINTTPSVSYNLYTVGSLANTIGALNISTSAGNNYAFDGRSTGSNPGTNVGGHFYGASSTANNYGIQATATGSTGTVNVGASITASGNPSSSLIGVRIGLHATLSPSNLEIGLVSNISNNVANKPTSASVYLSNATATNVTNKYGIFSNISGTHSPAGAATVYGKYEAIGDIDALAIYGRRLTISGDAPTYRGDDIDITPGANATNIIGSDIAINAGAATATQSIGLKVQNAADATTVLGATILTNAGATATKETGLIVGINGTSYTNPAGDHAILALNPSANILSSGVYVRNTATNAAGTSYGLYVNDTSSGSTAYGLRTDSIGTSTNTYGLSVRNNATGSNNTGIQCIVNNGTVSNLGLYVNASGTGAKLAQLIDGNQGAGKVLTSDASGYASWQTPTGGSGGGLTPTYQSGTTYTASGGDLVVAANAALIITLPTAASGLIIGVKTVVAPTGIEVRSAAAAETIDGQDRSTTGESINNQWDYMEFVTYSPDGGTTWDWLIR